MSFNKVVARVGVEILNKDGISIILSAATQTVSYIRPESPKTLRRSSSGTNTLQLRSGFDQR
jgi:hypothetical protein